MSYSGATVTVTAFVNDEKSRDSFSISITWGSGYSFLTKWGINGSGDGQFIYPYGVAVDSSGNVYVGDSGNNRIQKFSSSGILLTKWGTFGSGDGQFSEPSAIAVDSSGSVYVADTFVGSHFNLT